MSTGGTEIVSLSFDELDPVTAYGIWRLRSEVFVVEQQSPYPDLDGRDLEPGTRHVFAREGEVTIAYLRVLEEPDGGARIGRVCVAPTHRSAGWAGRLMARALAEIGDRPSVLDAQVQLTDWYVGFGYEVTGPAFEDDGVLHVPMRHTP